MSEITDDQVRAYLDAHRPSLKEPDPKEPSTQARGLIENPKHPRLSPGETGRGISPDEIRAAMEEDVNRGLSLGCSWRR